MLGMHLRMILFLCACIIGMLLAIILHWYQNIQEIRIIHLTRPLAANIDPLYLRWINDEGVKRQPIKDLEQLYYDKSRVYNIEADVLKKKISILCIIIAINSKRAKAINSTWAQHCNDHVFLSYSSGKFEGSLRTVRPSNSNVFEGLCSLIHKICSAELKIYDWTLIVEDKAFAVIENLRYFVSTHDSEGIHYFGHGMKADLNGVTYNMGHTGFVLSHGALQYLHKNTAQDCKSNSSSLPYDVAIGELFNRVNIKPVDTRDHLGRCRFNSFSMENLLVAGSIDLKLPYWSKSMFLSKEGMECCSSTAITFNNVPYKKMFFNYYLLYRLHMLKEGTGIGHVNRSDPAMHVTQKTVKKLIMPKPVTVDLRLENDEGARIIKKGFASLIKRKGSSSRKVTNKKTG